MESERLLEILRRSTKATVAGESMVAVAYSGGLDSSVVAAVAGEFSQVRCYTCAVRNSFDALHAHERARAESLSLTMIELTQRRLRSTAIEAIDVLETTDPVRLAYTIPILSVLEEAAEKLVLAGSGADELFGGYAKYRSIKDPRSRMIEDLTKMLDESHRLQKIAYSLKKTLGLPFVSEELIRYAESLPLGMKVGATDGKIVLRDVAKHLKLPSQHFPKKAAQYSSGILREMEKMAKSEKKSVSEWIASLGGRTRRSA